MLSNNVDDEQVSSFVSSFIAHVYVGITLNVTLMSVILPSHAVDGQQKCGFATA